MAGRWWTVLSAAWLHGGVLHIFLNMMAVRQLAPGVAELYGPGARRSSTSPSVVGGFGLSSFAGAFIPPLLILRGGQFTVGASAAIAGLIGALLSYGHRTGSSHAAAMARATPLS